MFFESAGIEANPLLVFLWAIFVGFVFSTVGAAGGILSGVGHITLLGIENANMIKVMNQFMVGLSSIVAVWNYVKMRRIVTTLGFSLGLGSVTGAILGATFSRTHLSSIEGYKFYFGLVVFLIALRVIYETTPRYLRKKESLARASARFEARVREARGDGADQLYHQGVVTLETSITRVRFSFYGEEFAFNPLMTFTAGALIAALSASIGVGGGFLYVPFMTSVVGLPMFIVAGTSAMAVIVSMATSILTYLQLGVRADWLLLGIELIGITIGSTMGPWVSKHFRERWLKGFLGAILLYIGARYIGIGI